MQTADWRARLSILKQSVPLSIDVFKDLDQRIEQITITHLLITQSIVLECQRCIIKGALSLEFCC